MINNAGASAFGEVEWSSIELYKHVAEVNLWGVIRCTKAFLPLIRRFSLVLSLNLCHMFMLLNIC